MVLLLKLAHQFDKNEEHVRKDKASSKKFFTYMSKIAVAVGLKPQEFDPASNRLRTSAALCALLAYTSSDPKKIDTPAHFKTEAKRLSGWVSTARKVQLLVDSSKKGVLIVLNNSIKCDRFQCIGIRYVKWTVYAIQSHHPEMSDIYDDLTEFVKVSDKGIDLVLTNKHPKDRKGLHSLKEYLTIFPPEEDHDYDDQLWAFNNVDGRPISMANAPEQYCQAMSLTTSPNDDRLSFSTDSGH